MRRNGSLININPSDYYMVDSLILRDETSVRLHKTEYQSSDLSGSYYREQYYSC